MHSLIIPLIMSLINPDRRFPIRQECPSLSGLYLYDTAFLQTCPIPLVAALNTKQRAFLLLAANCLVVASSCDVSIRCCTIQRLPRLPAYLLACVSILGGWQKYVLFLLFFFTEMETLPTGSLQPELSGGENAENSHTKTLFPLLKRANYKEKLNIVIAFTVASSSKTWKSVGRKILQKQCEYNILNLEAKAKFLLTLMSLGFLLHPTTYFFRPINCFKNIF